MPVVGKKNPRGKKKAVFPAALRNHPSPTGKFGLAE
jgi:hypothetical protein